MFKSGTLSGIITVEKAIESESINFFSILLWDFQDVQTLQRQLTFQILHLIHVIFKSVC